MIRLPWIRFCFCTSDYIRSCPIRTVSSIGLIQILLTTVSILLFRSCRCSQNWSVVVHRLPFFWFTWWLAMAITSQLDYLFSTLTCFCHFVLLWCQLEAKTQDGWNESPGKLHLTYIWRFPDKLRSEKCIKIIKALRRFDVSTFQSSSSSSSPSRQSEYYEEGILMNSV